MWSVSGWTIRSTDVGHDETITNGNRLLIGNGFLGYRGTVEEACADDMPATIVNGLYDRHGDKWREPVNFPNALSVRLFAGKTLLSPASAWLVSHEQSLDFRYGIHSRKTSWAIPLAEFSGTGSAASSGCPGRAPGSAPVTVSIEADRFASMDDSGLLCLRYSVRADGDVPILVETGIDGIVHDINGPHLSAPVSECIDGTLLLSCRTQELGVPLSVASSSSLEGGVSFLSASFFASKRLTLNLQAGKTVEFFVYGGVSAGIEADISCRGKSSPADCTAAHAQRVAEKAVSSASRARSSGWETLLARHREKWDAIWATGDVEIEGDDYAQSALRYSLYHLQIIAPRHAKNLSIPARGLSGQTYKGAIFWDTEMFIAPYFLATDPDVVKSFIRYRIGTLEGAKRKAAEYGHAGAFYAWESQETGDDACSDFNVVDVFTKRPLRTYFRDRQIHISADVVYALREYIDATGDRSLLAEGGLEMAVECARFFMSWAVWSPLRDRYEIHDVIGPDEYHERFI